MADVNLKQPNFQMIHVRLSDHLSVPIFVKYFDQKELKVSNAKLANKTILYSIWSKYEFEFSSIVSCRLQILIICEQFLKWATLYILFQAGMQRKELWIAWNTV